MTSTSCSVADDGADREGRAEAEGDVDGDADNRGERRVDALQLQFAADDRADDLLRQDLELAEAGRVSASTTARASFSRLVPSSCASCGRRMSTALSAGVAVALDDLLARHARFRAPAHPVVLDRLLELRHDDGAAGEVDAERHAAARDHEDHAGHDHQGRERPARASASG